MKPSTKILIVEDNLLSAMLMGKSLSWMGYTICEPVSSSAEAIASAKQNQPDLVLIDVGLDGALDGIETARQIVGCCHAAIIFITGYSADDIRDRAMALHPLAYLVKPVTAGDIKPFLDRLNLA